MLRFLSLLYLMLPVYAANMAAPFSRFAPRWARPIHERWLGSHKTWLGVGLAVLAASLVAWAQAQLAWGGELLPDARWFVLGPSCGLAAMLGDSSKSFVKRRLGIAPGQSWAPADQLDYVAAGLLALSWWVKLRALDVLLVLAVSWAGTVAVNRLSYRLGIKRTPN
jgi:CDP-2,3-bis-(O-geranylgeranyl)-sn-glycerol synthase